MDRGSLGFVLKLSRVVGVAPFTYAPNFQISRPLVTYGRIFIFINAILNYVVAASDFLLLKYKGDLTALQAIKIIGTILLTTLNTHGAITAPARLMRMVDYFKRLDQIDIQLQKRSKKDFEDNTNFKVPILFGGYFILLIMHVTADLNFRGNSPWTITMTNILYIFNIYISILLQLQITYFAQRVNSTLIAINDGIQRFVFDDDSDTSASPGQDNAENIPHKIRDLATFYGFICDIVKKNNEADGVIMLLSVMFIAMFLEAHTFVICTSIRPNPSVMHILLYEVYPVFSALCCILYIIYLIEQFHRTHNEMERTYYLINTGKSRKDGVEINHEFELFFRMIILNSVRYSPLDMCTLDRPLLIKLFSGLITYLVIMLQYAPETRSSFQLNYTVTITESVRFSNSVSTIEEF